MDFIYGGFLSHGGTSKSSILHSKAKVLAMYAGKAKTPSNLTASPRPPSRQRPCKTSILNVTAAFKKTSALLSLKIIRCYFAVERWLSGSHMSGKALMLRKIPNKFLNQNSPHKLGGVTEKVIKPAQTRDSQRYSWAALAYFSTVQAKQQQASSSRQSSSRQAAAGKSSAGKAATGK